MTHQEIRKSRILAMKKLVEDQNKVGFGFQTEKLIARLSIDRGVSRRTAQEYLSCCLISGELIEVDGFLWIPSFYHEWLALDKKTENIKNVDEVEQYINKFSEDKKTGEVKI